MKNFKHIVLLGAGAVGMLPAVKLQQLTDIKLTVAADAPRINRYRREGIFFNGEKIPLDFAAPEDMSPLPPADLVIVATKTPSLAEALVNVEKLTVPSTVFLPLLNGITADRVIAGKFPGNTVLRGYFLGHASVRENNCIRHDGTGTFYCGGEPDALMAVKQLFDRAGINMDIPENMNHAIWKKFVLNVGINQTQAFFDADYGQVQNSPEMQDFCRNLMLEAVMIAEKENIPGTAGMVDAAMEVIMNMPPDVKTSMLQDILSKRHTEVDAFAGTICAKAEKYALYVPFNSQVLDAIRRREKDLPAY